jgi:hypothetical protein
MDSGDSETGSESTVEPPSAREEGVALDPPTSEAVANSPSPGLSRRAVLGGAIVVAGAAAAAIVLVVSKSSNGIGEGSGTATITWVPTRTESTDGNPPQPFTGTIGGLLLNGVATTAPTAGIFGSPSSPSRTVPKDIPLFIWKGTLGGMSFRLVISITGLNLNSLSKPSAGGAALKITGTYGSENVIGDVPVPSADLDNNSSPIDFHGTVGARKVTGVVHAPTGDGKLQTATASYTVTES